MRSINFFHYRSIVILTGAGGISAASGIRPFRGQGGLWNEIDPIEHSDCSLIETNWSVSPSAINPKLIILKILRKSADIASQKCLR